MNNRIIRISVSKKGNKIAYAVLSPSVDQFVLGGKSRLVRFMAPETAAVGGSINLSDYTVGQTEALPPRTDGKPSHFSDVTWLDAKK